MFVQLAQYFKNERRILCSYRQEVPDLALILISYWTITFHISLINLVQKDVSKSHAVLLSGVLSLIQARIHFQ